MPYKLSGTKVVKSDSGEVVKDHPTREQALAHLRALKANVEEGSPGVLAALLEGVFDEAKHPRGAHGRFKIGDVVRYSEASRGPGGHGEVVLTPQPGLHTVVGLQRNGYLRLKHPDTGTTVDVPHQHATVVPPMHPDYRGKVVQDAYAAQRSVIAAERAARARAVGGGGAFDPVTMLGREGTAARERGASSLASEHADTRDKLTNLPAGQTYGLHGPRGQVGRVDRTARGFEVYGPHEAAPKVHQSPSSAAGHAMRIQRAAAQSPKHADVAQRNYAHHQEVARMNARQAQRAESEVQRQVAIRARAASNPRVREDAPGVLGALLERDFTAEKRRQLAKSGAAMPDGSFPIENAGDVDSAVKLARTAAQRAHVKKRAKAVGASGRIPDGWGSGGD